MEGRWDTERVGPLQKRLLVFLLRITSLLILLEPECCQKHKVSPFSKPVHLRTCCTAQNDGIRKGVELQALGPVQPAI